jgi:hypothetical protein
MPDKQRVLITVMCDDVRREEGNKLSYMGIYGSNLAVRDFPVVLPKLCFVMSVVSDASENPPESLIFRIFRDDELLGEMTFSEEALTVVGERAENSEGRDAKRLVVGTVLQLFPLQLPGPCVLKARAIWDSEELKGGSWLVEKVIGQH